MSRCVEKPFAPCWQCGRTRGFRPVPHRAVTAWGGRGHWATAVGRWHTP